MIAKRLLWLSISIIVVGGSLLIWHVYDPNFSFFDSKSSLKETLKEVQDGLNRAGPVSYTLNFHNSSTGEDKTVPSRLEISQVSADPNSCFLIYEQRAYRDTAHRDTGYVIELKSVKKVDVVTIEQEVKNSGVLIDHPGFTVQSTPPVFVMETIKGEMNDRNAFLYLNREQAEKMAKVLTRAVEGCGGGK
jgi:hypothetical protein